MEIESKTEHLILIVSHSQGTLEMLRLLLSQSGYRILTALDGQEGCAIAEREQPELIISEAVMPGLSGLELSRFIRQHPDLNKTPVLLVSVGISDWQIVDEVLRAGADDYLETPFSPALLFTKVAQLIEHKRVEEKLREREAGYRDLFENANDAIYTLDLAGNLTSMNRAGEIITGYSRHELMGTNIARIIVPEYVEVMRNKLAAKLAGETLTTYELEIIAKDGNRKSLEISSRLIYQKGNAIGLQGMARDNTERKKHEVSLREREDLYHTAFSNAPVGIAHTDLDGRWLRVNQRFCDILGYSSEELLTKTYEDICYREDFETENMARQQYLAGEIQGYGHEKRFIRKDGAVIWVYFVIELLRGSAGEPKYFITVVQDITDRIKLEQQLLQSQKMEAVGHLAGGIAHDFNNLLTAIIGYSELTIKRLPGESTVRRHIIEIKNAADHAALLTRQLLAFSRQQVLEPKHLNLNNQVASLENLFRRLIGENIELWTLLEPEIGTIKADPGQIEQVLMNLVINARDAMPNGGKLTVETANVYLNEEYASQHLTVPSGQYVMLAVTDTGIGMDEQIQARIFEPFFTTKKPGKGSGLGLSTVYGIVKQSGGNIWVYSEVGQGTTFKVYLPRVDKDVQEDQGTSELEEDLRGTETILLAEDNHMVRNLIRTVLEGYGYQVLDAANGGDAYLIGKHYQESIDLLLTDILMPEMSGLILANRLKQRYPQLKTLYMSGYTDEVIFQQGILETDKPYLQKPFTPLALGRKVREVLEKVK